MARKSPLIFPKPAYTIFSEDRRWFVTAPDGTHAGPYQDGRVALKVALARLVHDSKGERQAPLLVRDARGRFRSCAAADFTGAGVPCDACRKGTPGRSSSSCPLGNELRPGAPDVPDEDGAVGDPDIESDSRAAMEAAPAYAEQDSTMTAQAAGEARSRWTRRRVALTVMLSAALLSTVGLLAPRLSRSFAPPVERGSARMIKQTPGGGCEQFEFDNTSAMLISKGPIRCDPLASQTPRPTSASQAK
jgi:hypothetical protein